MVVLALDTTTAAGSVAVVRGGETRIERRGDPGRPHAVRLPADLTGALDAADLRLSDVGLLAVAIGPGAFTGLRIGIATMQGLAFSLGVPIAGVSALDALALHAAASRFPADEGGAHPSPSVLVWMDAARGEVFSAEYGPADSLAVETIRPLADPAVGHPNERLRAAAASLGGSRSLIAIGEGALRYRDILTSGLPVNVVHETPPIAATVARLAAAAAAQGRAGRPHAIRPLYVRRPDAELARDRVAAAESRP